MCGRYYIDDGETVAEMRKIIEEVNLRYHDTPLGDAMKTGEIFPTNVAPVLIASEESSEPVLMTWGFPKWQASGVIINARSETAQEKPMFMKNIQNRRCIIPSNGFFEWDHANDHPKSKFLITAKDSQMLYMAGLYSSFEDQFGGKYSAYVILTVGANADVILLHDRMPLIIEPEQNNRWLNDEKYARSILRVPCPAKLTALEAN